MKILSVVLLLAILCSHQLVSGGTSNDCCVKYSNTVVPLKKIVSYYKTSSSCPMQAIVLNTMLGKRCVNPEKPWVKRHVAALEKQKTAITTLKQSTQI